MPVQKLMRIMAIFMNYGTIQKIHVCVFFGVTWQASQLVAPGHSGAWFTRWFTAAGAVLGFSIADWPTDWKLEAFCFFLLKKKVQRWKCYEMLTFFCVWSLLTCKWSERRCKNWKWLILFRLDELLFTTWNFSLSTFGGEAFVAFHPEPLHHALQIL